MRCHGDKNVSLWRAPPGVPRRQSCRRSGLPGQRVFKRNYLSTLVICLLTAFLAMQPPDEVRVSSHAYVPQSPYTLRVDTKLVEIAATVRDAHGKPVSSL